jgi:hypothetical protein
VDRQRILPEEMSLATAVQAYRWIQTAREKLRQLREVEPRSGMQIFCSTCRNAVQINTNFLFLTYKILAILPISSSPNLHISHSTISVYLQRTFTVYRSYEKSLKRHRPILTLQILHPGKDALVRIQHTTSAKQFRRSA